MSRVLDIILRARLRSQLYIGIGGAVAMTLLATVVAWVSFDRVADSQRLVNEGAVPEMAAAFGIAQQAAAVVAAAPRLTVAESVEELGAVSFIISTPAVGHWWHQPEFDQVWETATTLDVPISLHGNETKTGEPAAYDRYNGMGGPFEAIHHAINFPMENMIGVAHFMLSGILDRYPKMKLSILEANCGWLPFWLSRLENCSDGRQAVTFDADPLQATPYEYYVPQCFIACDADEPGIKFATEHVGDNNIVFNTDYPHADAPDPWEPVPNMMEQPISDESKRKILWDNSVRLYGERLLEGVKTG